MDVSALIKQKSYEKVIHLLRRDAITFLPKILFFIILFAIPVVIYFFIQNAFPNALEDSLIYPLLVLGGSVFYLSILLFFYTEFIIFYLDLSIITNDRIVEMEQIGLFSRTVSELELFRIQDITSEVNGVIATLFRYGNVHITTASENTQIILYNVPHPEKIREELIQLSHEDRKYHMQSIDLDEN